MYRGCSGPISCLYTTLLLNWLCYGYFPHTHPGSSPSPLPRQLVHLLLAPGVTLPIPPSSCLHPLLLLQPEAPVLSSVCYSLSSLTGLSSFSSNIFFWGLYEENSFINLTKVGLLGTWLYIKYRSSPCLTHCLAHFPGLSWPSLKSKTFQSFCMVSNSGPYAPVRLLYHFFIPYWSGWFAVPRCATHLDSGASSPLPGICFFSLPGK